jgi:hypothetical protein
MRQIQQAAHPQLVGLANVIGTGLGAKYVGGELTGTPALAIFVSEKMPASQLAPSHVVPTELNGLVTDVIEEGALTATSAALGEMEAVDYRPLMGGTTITTELTIVGGCGTLGCFVQPASDPASGPPSKVLLLTSYHVLFLVDPDDPFQTLDDIPRDALGQYRASPSCGNCCNDQISKRIRRGVYSPTVDAACAEILTVVDGNDEEEKYRTQFRHEIQDVGVVAGPCDPTVSDCLDADARVIKRGGFSYLTEGTVTHVSVNLATKVKHDYGDFIVEGRQPMNQIRIAPPTGRAFGGSGDSGSVVVNHKNEIIGLLHDVSTAGNGFADNISAVLTALDVKLLTETADNLGNIKHVPGPLSNGKAAASAQQRRVRELRNELASRARSKPMVAAFYRHQDEITALINGNRRVMVGWHRLGGAELMRHLSHATLDSGYPLPARIGSRKWSAAVRDLSDLLATHGSPQLRGSLASHADDLQSLGGLRLPQILDAMGQREAECRARPEEGSP